MRGWKSSSVLLHNSGSLQLGVCVHGLCLERSMYEICIPLMSFIEKCVCACVFVRWEREIGCIFLYFNLCLYVPMLSPPCRWYWQKPWSWKDLMGIWGHDFMMQDNHKGHEAPELGTGFFVARRTLPSLLGAVLVGRSPIALSINCLQS